jgi:hypothetical protein
MNFTNKRKAPHHRAAGLIGPKSEFGLLRLTHILMRYGGKFSTTLLAKGGGGARRPHKRNPDLLEPRDGLRGIP